MYSPLQAAARRRLPHEVPRDINDWQGGMRGFKGKVVLVAGGGPKLGTAIASLIHASEALVGIADHDFLNAALIADTLDWSGSSAIALNFDPSGDRASEGCVASLMNKFGRIDYLVIVAAIADPQSYQPAIGEDRASRKTIGVREAEDLLRAAARLSGADVPAVIVSTVDPGAGMAERAALNGADANRLHAWLGTLAIGAGATDGSDDLGGITFHPVAGQPYEIAQAVTSRL